MKDEQTVRGFMETFVKPENQSLFTRFMNLSPDTYRKCIDAMCDGLVSINEMITLPYVTDDSVNELLGARAEEMSFVYLDAPVPFTEFDANAYCNTVLGLGELVSLSVSAENVFQRTEWTRLLSKTKIGMDRQMPHYDSMAQLSADFASAATTMPDPRDVFPMDGSSLFQDLSQEGWVLGARVYNEVFMGRGIVESFYSGDQWKCVVGLDGSLPLLACDVMFSEDIFNGFYPYRNTLFLAKDIRATVASGSNMLSTEEIDAMMARVKGIEYRRSIRNKITHMMVASWIAGKLSINGNGLYPEIGTIAGTIAQLMGFMKDYLAGLSAVCSRYMKVS